ncbi:hypothetical protein [Wenyingzhuangia sp. 2_MG-2023]|uniref:hypothetical protein n=1 Tax=Wenyingzhuangia sp. 2_MG-2023 TaxID=3062639 RepID=UPI0026E15E2E|nr:hypothetical protein [Wenyingzhuangia sp. 2_MG-2023]MDO6737062.1 hypothetical protein [Wenyingzhuangia sp. 2_MG-2023]
MKSNKQKIEALTKEMLKEATKQMQSKIKKAIESGSLDTDNWSEKNNKMILPKIILIAILENEADQYKATGTRFEKEVKKEVKNIKYFI